MRLVMASMFHSLRDWVAETVTHAIGNPSEEKKTIPPSIGCQPYRDVPQRSLR